MTEVLHSSPGMPISSVSSHHGMKRLVDDMGEYSPSKPHHGGLPLPHHPAMHHSSPVDLLTQYAMGGAAPLHKKARLDSGSSSLSPRGPSSLSPRALSDKDYDRYEGGGPQHNSSDDMMQSSFMNQSGDSSICSKRTYSSEDIASGHGGVIVPRDGEGEDCGDEGSMREEQNPSKGFPCVWLNNSVDERDGGSPGPHPDGEDMDKIVVVQPVEDGEGQDVVPSPRKDGPGDDGSRSFPCVWLNGDDMMDRPKSPGQTAMCEPTMPGDSPVKSPHLKHGSAPSPNTDRPLSTPHHPHKDIGGGALNMLASRMPMEAQSPPRSNLQHIAGLPPSLLAPSPDTVATPATEEPGMEVCPECNKVFKRKVYLQRHMEREHWSTAKVFKCDDCAYETKHQSNLSVHRRIHTGERPYHCGLCGQRYTQGHLLKSHIRSRHGGNMEFYNLDKKSDSTRGRKSLDPKQDGRTHDKISTLLAQHAAQGTKGMPSPIMPPFMGGMAPFPLRPLMAPPLGMPPNLMGGHRLFGLPGLGAGGHHLLAGHAAQAQHIVRSMPLPMPEPHLPAMSSAGSSDKPKTSSQSKGIKIPLKIPDMPPMDYDVSSRSDKDKYLSSSRRSLVPSPLGRDVMMSSIKKEPSYETNTSRSASCDDVPEDLSTGRKTQSPETPTMRGESNRSPETPSSAADKAAGVLFSISAADRRSSTPSSRMNGGSASASPAPPQLAPPRDSTTSSMMGGVSSPATPIGRAESPEGTPVGSEHRRSSSDVTMTPDLFLPTTSSASTGTSSKLPMPYPHYIQALARGGGDLMHDLYAAAAAAAASASPEPSSTPTSKRSTSYPPEGTPTSNSFLPLDLKKEDSPRRTTSSKTTEHDDHHEHTDKCSVESCPHASKLRKLRKNIMRMLSVLSPELGVEGCLDYNTDEVDEMLHEVIYSNTEDDLALSRKT